MESAQAGVDYEEALMTTVEEIWSEWDKDGNGYLDKSEMKGFITATMKQANPDHSAEISDEEFTKIFAEFDIDGSNTIEKDEMAVLVKRMAGL